MKVMKTMTMKISMVRKSLRINSEYRSNHKTDRVLKLFRIIKANIRSCSLFSIFLTIFGAIAKYNTSFNIFDKMTTISMMMTVLWFFGIISIFKYQ
jgi:hypothetical protein